MKPLGQQLQLLEQILLSKNVVKTSVSKKSSHWHAAHSLSVIEKVLLITAGKIAAPEIKPQGKPFLKWVILKTGFIPRGKAKAPKAVTPLNIPPTIDSVNRISNIALLKEEIMHIKPHPFFHPSLGKFDFDQTLRFLQIHTNHHLKIIKDLQKKS